MTQIQQLDAELQKLEKQCANISNDLTAYNEELDALQKKHNYHNLRTEQKHLENEIYTRKNSLMRAKADLLITILLHASSADSMPIEISTPNMDCMLNDLETWKKTYVITINKHESGDTYTIIFGPHKITVAQDIFDEPDKLDVQRDHVTDILGTLTREEKLEMLSRLKTELSVDVGLHSL